jgi:hypothetical protein
MTNGKASKSRRRRARALPLRNEGDAGPPPAIELPMIYTDPGCDHPDHRLEVQGAMMALASGHWWSGRTLMDCGCYLSIDGS